MKKHFHKSFSLIELIFTILIIGIIMTIAIKSFEPTLSKSSMIKLKNDFLIIQSGINQYKNRLLLNEDLDPLDQLEESDSYLFSKILKHPIISDPQKGWEKIDSNSYIFHLNKDTIEFIYDGEQYSFTCNKQEDLCKEIMQ